MPTRADVLTDPTHRLVVQFTPKQSSWLNQIEVWFSILMRKLLRRSSFTSQADLKAKILAFVDYFNRTLAKPFSEITPVSPWSLEYCTYFRLRVLG